MKAMRLVREGESRLITAGVPEARNKAEWWTSEVLSVRRDQLEKSSADEKQIAEFESGIARLEKHEPLQHVIGHTPFLNVDLFIDKRALIPRPETEELVSNILSCEGLWSQPEVRIADVGTGSGCIAIALAANKGPARVTAIDLSPDALELARGSAAELGITGRIRFLEQNLLGDTAPGSLDAVVSNPPYIATEVIRTLEESVSRFEPLAALDGGPDGLDVIRPLILQAFTTLKKGGRLWLEIGDEQGDAVRGLLESAGFQQIVIKQDMYGQVRFAEGIK